MLLLWLDTFAMGPSTRAAMFRSRQDVTTCTIDQLERLFVMRRLNMNAQHFDNMKSSDERTNGDYDIEENGVR
ncbi:hypothetical protein RB195_021045 [Necator americanus]|uniref:Uncharacterized protein n=1 Tax=Necator americanus TaxID=51031 RepID=A0ABR1E922_NECAM